MPDPQNPDDQMYQFIDTQPLDAYPASRDASPSHFTVRQFTPEAITASFPIIVTKTNHGLQNGQALRATKFVSIPFAVATGMEQINNKLFYVQRSTTNTFVLSDRNTLPIDGRSFTPYVQGGQFTLTGPDIQVVNPSHFPPAGIVVQ